MKQLLVINPEKVTKKEVKSYPTREAVRAIVFDNDGKIALLHVVKSKYYKLPGGGIEKGEDKKRALKRECQEEVGSEIEILDEIGSIVEYRKIFKLKQISYCYLAKLKGNKGNPSFTDEEVEGNFEPVWLSLEDALQAISKNVATSIEGSAYIVPRDTVFLEESRKYLI
ncbi:MAG: NUDIX hydrolase [uncultured bacterium]|uniref:Nudix hydrolase domain-containing protein n=1 Tax=Candidatus Woesebacteria bacterium RIFCSPHIGHO2_12_FULL_41_24 TaxID=1802510 RepID=A0A1F8AT43_9BACT|nr:MAG: NUDIX hydrolase [uncultured bacterium]OGM14078.1 MAG: hypothetical protein A2W15_03345 [Candidatus Woesebacteria bacterium RBG_16_41_13]OGM29390.1 MAG: hypothetical protein A2873_04600 [Candidatus Woesebacteria bacterium RIFCSPHIGHO2_01_FULL_42_80]OGM34839.1 MAG: hypothetical protein A3D84_03155 [Candidatus Woesebacteria bacterium RIFCSPHIGHO2_02_FULL_42_20]OGM54468.1 MAG: hypothetical protein A3E44_00190 [Candidatus Woesebacteria bacterium RIFCSPHIGHO2_12_FULL_41_24]OGM65712.1 MAG: hy